MNGALYTGTFDPITNGHHDLVRRTVDIFGRVLVAIAANPGKAPLFTVDERVAIVKDVFAGRDNVSVDTFEGLLVDYAQQKGASVIVRGLRAVSDFEYEFQMALMNRHLAPHIETTFLMPAEQYTYISSRLIKEVFSLGGPIDGLVPRVVEAKLLARRQGRPLPDARST